MSRERRFALVVMMTVSGMNALVTATLLGLALVGSRRFDVTELTLLVFSIGVFVLARAVYSLSLRLEAQRLAFLNDLARIGEMMSEITARPQFPTQIDGTSETDR